MMSKIPLSLDYGKYVDARTKELEKAGLNSRWAVRIAQTEKELNERANITSGFRDLEKDMKLAEEKLESIRKDYGFEKDSKVWKAIVENWKNRDIGGDEAGKRAAKIGGSKAYDAVRDARNNKAVPGKSKHTSGTAVDLKNSQKFIDTLLSKQAKEQPETRMGSARHLELERDEKKDYGEVFGPANSLSEEKLNVDKVYNDLSFKDAFETAMKDKGEGNVFKWKGKEYLLKRAEPEPPPIKPDLKTLLQQYQQLKPSIDVVDDVPTYEEMNYIPEEENINNVEPQPMDLQELIDRGEELVKKQNMYKNGGKKYQNGTDTYEPTPNDMQFVPEDDTDNDPISNAILQNQVQNMTITDSANPRTNTEKLLEEYLSLKDQRNKQLENARLMDTISAITSQVGQLAPNQVNIRPTNFENQAIGDQQRALNEITRLSNSQQRIVPKSSLPMSEYQKKMLELKEKELASKGVKPVEPTFLEKEKIKASIQDEISTKKEARKEIQTIEEKLPKLDEQLSKAQKALDMLNNVSKGSFTDTGPLDQYVAGFTEKGQALRQAINDVSLDKMTKMFEGMSKAVDSDAERRFFEQAQASMGNYPEVNKKILQDMIKNIQSLKDKSTLKLKELKGEPVSTDPKNITEDDIDNMSIEELKKAGLI